MMFFFHRQCFFQHIFPHKTLTHFLPLLSHVCFQISRVQHLTMINIWTDRSVKMQNRKVRYQHFKVQHLQHELCLNVRINSGNEYLFVRHSKLHTFAKKGKKKKNMQFILFSHNLMEKYTQLLPQQVPLALLLVPQASVTFNTF